MKTSLLLIAALLVALPVFALDYDQYVTPDVIFGSGNANGAFTTDTAGDIELGLRGKIRFDASNLPQNIFNSNGDGSYNFLAGHPTGGAGWATVTTPFWNFEFAVNTNLTGMGQSLDAYTYELGLDFDPSPAATNYLVFDPITPSVPVPFYDHAIGDNVGTIVTAGDAATYAGYLSTYNVVQNSWSYEFVNNAPFDTFDPDLDGVYEIYLKALLNGAVVAQTQITIVVGSAVADEAATWGAVKTLFR
jgi:hypothetical protein